jgi:hypothetical protein
MDVCLLNQAGATLLHRTMKTNPATLLQAIAPYRDGLVVAVAWLFPWYGLADLCADAGLPCVLGHALSMQAIHGGKATNDTIDAQKMAAVLRGGMLPQASVSPAPRRATHDLVRRRMPLAHKRAALLAPVHQSNRQDTLPAIGNKMASQATRDGVAERCAEPAVHKSIAVDLALLTSYDALLRDGALTILTTAQHHDAHTRDRLQTVPGLTLLVKSP